MKVLAIGGAGHVGSEVVKELLKRNAEVDVLVRKEGTKVSEGAKAVVGDLLDPVLLEKALDGIDKLYLLNAVTPDELTQALITYDLAKRLKVKHIVYHSVFGPITSKMCHTSPRSSRWKALCTRLTFRLRSCVQTTSTKMTLDSKTR